MSQILQAYVRPQLAARIIRALVDAGCHDLFLTEARRVVAGLDESDAEYSVHIGQKIEVMSRIDAMGTIEEVQHWSAIVRQAGWTGRHGDGVVVIATAAEAFHLSGSRRADSAPDPGRHGPDA